MKIKAEGFKDFGESWENWVLLDAKEVQDMSNNDILDELNMFPFSSDPGMQFATRPIIRRQNSRVLITQLAGIDI